DGETKPTVIVELFRDYKDGDPVKIEFDLMKVLPKDHWILYNIQIIRLGRNICFARNPKCEECFLRDLCKAGKGK
ncbi:MAG: hypothetical protein EGR98_00505, partial [Prevotella sp.]|nr:hypothetical protein [Prevotella sp.]